ncbi:Cytochrome P450 89A2 [Hordeum vulgare]|nr:Cytochrome P450 89A2 [Hordeum vulgare]
MDANSRPTQGSDPATGSGGGGGADPTAPSATGAQLQQEACGKIINKMYSIFHLAPLLRDLHARYGPIISIRLFRALVFVSDRRLAHRVLVQGGSTFVDRPRLFEPGLIFTSGSRNINATPYGPYWRLVRRNLAPRRCTRPASASSRQRGAGCATRSSATFACTPAPETP